MFIETIGSGDSPPDLYLPISRIAGYVLEVLVMDQQLGGCFRTPFGDAGYSVGGVTGQRQKVGDGTGEYAEFLKHAGLVKHLLPASVVADHRIPLDHLG